MRNDYLKIITEAGLYDIASHVYMGYLEEDPPLTFLEWCRHKFDSTEDEFLSLNEM